MKTADEIRCAQSALDKAVAEQAEIMSEMVRDWIYEDVTLTLFGVAEMKETPQACQDQFDRMQERGAKLNLVTGRYLPRAQAPENKL